MLFLGISARRVHLVRHGNRVNSSLIKVISSERWVQHLSVSRVNTEFISQQFVYSNWLFPHAVVRFREFNTTRGLRVSVKSSTKTTQYSPQCFFCNCVLCVLYHKSSDSHCNKNQQQQQHPVMNMIKWINMKTSRRRIVTSHLNGMRVIRGRVEELSWTLERVFQFFHPHLGCESWDQECHPQEWNYWKQRQHSRQRQGRIRRLFDT